VIPNILTIGEPGSGKSFGSASDVLKFPGAKFIGDPHKNSLGKLVLTHATGNVLYDRLDDLDHSLGYGLLKASQHPNAMKRLQENQRRAKIFVEVMMRRRGGDIAGTPLMEEWIMAALLLFLYQRTPSDPGLVPFAFRPGTEEFQELVHDCTASEIRAKFKALEKLNPRGLRAEVGSATRLVSPFSDPAFLLRCRTSFDLGAFLQVGGTLILERGDADEDVTRTIIGGINLLVTDYCESRPKPFPPVGIWLDECTNARTAGPFEEKKAGETRKFGLHWRPICQHPNFPGGSEGWFQNCQEKHFYRCGDHTLARKLAAFVVAGMGRGEESRASAIDSVTSELMNFKPGWRYVVGPSGTRKEYVPMIQEPWPDWPGLREAKMREKLCQIHARPEYGVPYTPSSSTSSRDEPAPSSKPPKDSSAADRWKRSGRKRTGGSSSSGDGSD
jgi:hypothetical protein